jgi:hypothetical protein
MITLKSLSRKLEKLEASIRKMRGDFQIDPQSETRGFQNVASTKQGFDTRKSGTHRLVRSVRPAKAKTLGRNAREIVGSDV